MKLSQQVQNPYNYNPKLLPESRLAEEVRKLYYEALDERGSKDEPFRINMHLYASRMGQDKMTLQALLRFLTELGYDLEVSIVKSCQPLEMESAIRSIRSSHDNNS